MEKFSTAIIFDHRGRTETEKEGPLEVRITIGRKPYYINTGIKVKRNEWAGSVVSRPDMDALNDRLGFIIRRVVEEINTLHMNGDKFDVQIVRERVFNTDEKKNPEAFLDWLDEEVPKLKVADGTRKRYVCLQNRLYEFGKIKTWDDLKVERIYEFDHWLHSIEKEQSNGDKQAGRKAERIGNAAVYNYHKTLKAMLHRALKFGLIESNPYDRLKGEFNRGNKENVEYLTEEEIQAFESLRPVEGTIMAASRDLFVFQLYTGMSYSDAQAFDIRQYKKVNGKWVHMGERIKTGVPFVSQLLPPVIEVLERYGWQAPKVNNADYNKCLKMLGMAAGITTRLHSHLARHTFATRMLRWGVKIENVSRMLGHTNITQTQKYAKVLAQSVHEDYEKVEDILSKMNEKKEG